MQVITVSQPRAYFIAHRLQGVITYEDDFVGGLLKLRERIAIHAGPDWSQEAYKEIARYLTGPVTRKKHLGLDPEGFQHGVILCRAKVASMGWLDPICCGGCLCDPTNKFGVTLTDLEPLLPSLPFEAETSEGEVWEWNEQKQERTGQALLFS